MTKRGSDELALSPGMDDITKKPDLKPSPVKDENREAESAKIQAEIQESAPSWFANAFAYILKEFGALRVENQTIHSCQSQMNSDLKSMEDKIKKLEESNKQQSNIISDLEDKICHLETHTRQDNLLFDGILESPNEDLHFKVNGFINSVLNVPETITFSRIYRLGKPPHLVTHPVNRPRTIIAKFQYLSERDKVWKASWSLKHKTYRVSEDYPESVMNNRKQLLPILKAAKKDPTIKKCSLRGDKLLVDGKGFTIRTINSLPQNLQWAVKGTRYAASVNTTFFFGRQSFLSNFHPAPFEENGIRYSCSEQFYLYKKSMFFDDDSTATAILRSKDPVQMKGISRSIKNVDDHKWNKHARSAMEKACMLKFSQNPDWRDWWKQMFTTNFFRDGYGWNIQVYWKSLAG